MYSPTEKINKVKAIFLHYVLCIDARVELVFQTEK